MLFEHTDSKLHSSKLSRYDGQSEILYQSIGLGLASESDKH